MAAVFDLKEVVSYFKEVAGSLKFQISAAITFGSTLLLVWLEENNQLKIFLTILFLFPTCMFVGSIIEKIYVRISNHRRKKVAWNNLSPQEEEFIAYYIKENTRTRYMPAYNGTYRDSGIINPLIGKRILYLASNMSEFRGESWMSAEQHFPVNIRDDAFSFFTKKLSPPLSL